MTRHNKTGRSRGTGRFVALDHAMLKSAAWSALSTQDRAVYLVLAQIYDGSNNGRLGLGVRDAAHGAGINKDTAGRSFKRLQETGFIETAQPGSFSTNGLMASEWRMTAYKCNRTGASATRAFMKWLPENSNACPKARTTRSQTEGHVKPEQSNSVPRFRTVGRL